MPYLLFLVESDIHWSPSSQTPWAIDAKFLWAWLVLKALLLVSRCIFSCKFYWWGLSYFDLGFTAEVNFAFLSLEKHNFLDGPGIWKHLWERGSFDALNTTVKGAWCPHWIVVALQCYCEILFVWPTQWSLYHHQWNVNDENICHLASWCVECSCYTAYGHCILHLLIHWYILLGNVYPRSPTSTIATLQWLTCI